MLKNNTWALAATAISLLAAAGAPAAQEVQPAGPALRMNMICPIPKAHKDSEMFAVPVRVNGIQLYACDDVNMKLFKKDPVKYLKGEVVDPVNGQRFPITAKSPKAEHGKDLYFFSSAETRAAFLKNPGKYVKGR
jgi:YHS domain-containing protein